MALKHLMHTRINPQEESGSPTSSSIHNRGLEQDWIRISQYVEELLTLKMAVAVYIVLLIGQDILQVWMHIDVKRGIPIEEAYHISDEIDKRVHPIVKGIYCFTHK